LIVTIDVGLGKVTTSFVSHHSKISKRSICIVATLWLSCKSESETAGLANSFGG
jgi:hypothetical protein